ncbi:MAG: hypothetical protein ACPGVT_08380 [Maricaulaceae bacterium]
MELKDKPIWQIVLRGAAIPGMIVVFCSVIGAVMAIFNGNDIWQTAKIGVWVGLFFSLWGGLEIMILIVVESKENRTNFSLALGYFIVWASCLFIIFSQF